MNIKTTLLSALLSISTLSFSQTNSKVSGKIINGGDQKIIDAATVSLLALDESQKGYK